MEKSWIGKALLIAVTLFSFESLAADISLGSPEAPNAPLSSNNRFAGYAVQNRNAIWLQGEIQPGDYEKFVSTYMEGRIDSASGVYFPHYLRITSPGGDLREAIKIAEFVEQMKVNAMMAGPCNSACFFILVGSPKRIFAATVGLHRPYFDRQYFGDLTADQAQVEYSNLLAFSENWLKERFVSSFLMDKMVRTSSFEAYVMDYEQIEKELGKVSPIHEEWIAAKCGYLTEPEKADQELVLIENEYGKLGATELQSIEPIDLRRQVIESLTRAQGLSEGYKEYLGMKVREVEDCEYASIAEVRRQLIE